MLDSRQAAMEGVAGRVIAQTRRLGLLIVVTVMAWLASTPASTVGGGRDKLTASTYTGSFARMPGARVKLRVFSRGDEPVRVRFRFRRVKLRCDDGRVQVRSLDWRSEEFQGRYFDDVEYYDPPSFAWETYIRVQGRLVGNAKARGSVFYYNNPPAFAPNRECTTASGIARWRAERRR